MFTVKIKFTKTYNERKKNNYIISFSRTIIYSNENKNSQNTVDNQHIT